MALLHGAEARPRGDDALLAAGVQDSQSMLMVSMVAAIGLALMMLLGASLVYCAIVMRQQGVYQHVGQAYMPPSPLKTVYVDRVQEEPAWALPLSRDRLRAERRAERDAERQWEREEERRRRERRRARRDARREERERERRRRRREHRRRHRYHDPPPLKDHQSDVESSHGPSTLSTSSGGSSFSDSDRSSSLSSDDGRARSRSRSRPRARTRPHPSGHVPGRRRREYVGERATLEQQTVLVNERQQEQLLADLNADEWELQGAPAWMQ